MHIVFIIHEYMLGSLLYLVDAFNCLFTLCIILPPLSLLQCKDAIVQIDVAV